MKIKSAKSGGGYSMSITKSSRAATKVEPVTHKGSPAGVAQIGAATAFRKEPMTSGKGYEPQKMGDSGSRSYFNSAKEGPGSGRTIFKAGTQSATPAPKELPKGREILGAYGPERSKG